MTKCYVLMLHNHLVLLSISCLSSQQIYTQYKVVIEYNYSEYDIATVLLFTTKVNTFHNSSRSSDIKLVNYIKELLKVDNIMS